VNVVPDLCEKEWIDEILYIITKYTSATKAIGVIIIDRRTAFVAYLHNLRRRNIGSHSANLTGLSGCRILSAAGPTIYLVFMVFRRRRRRRRRLSNWIVWCFSFPSNTLGDGANDFIKESRHVGYLKLLVDNDIH
jgi:hypothetical protein